MKETVVLGIRYTGQEMEDYYRVKELAEKNKDPLSTTGKLLINRGLTHTDNPEPLVKTVKKVVEKIVPADRYPYCKNCNGQPQLKPEPKHLDEGITAHIIDDHIGEGVQSQQRSSGDKLTTGNKAEPSPNTALDIKKSPNDEGSNLGGWIFLGGILTVLFGPVVYRWLTPKEIEPVNQIGKPSEFTEQIDQRFV